MIKNARFVSVWDGEYTVESDCKVDTKKKTVFDIETVDVGNSFDSLTEQYVIVDDKEIPCFESEDEAEMEEVTNFYLVA